MNRRALSTALTLSAALLLFDARAFAQESATPTRQATTQPSHAPASTPDSRTVKLRLSAYDKKGRAVELKRENVHVYVDGVEQPVDYFAAAVSPASYGLVVDNSGSLRSQIAAVIAAGQSLANSNGPSDETFIVRFISSDNIKIMQSMTADKAALAKTLNDMFIEKGQTALLDAVYLSGDYLAKNVRADDAAERRHALVLITDGEDRASYYNAEQVIKLLRAGDVQVFAIGLIGELDKNAGFISTSKRGKSKDLLEKLTNETGGRAFFAETVGELKDAIAEIGKNLHTQYLVGYTPPAPDNKKHKVEVKAFGEDAGDKLKVTPRPEPAREETRKN